MTISSTVRKAGPFDGTGSQTEFPFEFKVFSAEDLYVVRFNEITGVETVLELDSHYTVTLNEDQNEDPGGTVELVSALPVNYTLTLTSSIANLQPTDLTNRGGFYPSVINDALDRTCIQIQQIQDEADRTLKTAISVPDGVDNTLPMPAPNMVIGWDNTGAALKNWNVEELVTSVAYGSAKADIFEGDGETVEFFLENDPASINNLDVSVGGVCQVPGDDYTWISGTKVTFTVAPPEGETVLIRYMQALPQGTVDAPNVAYTASGVGAVRRTGQDKFAETVSVKDFGAVGDGVTDDTAAIQNAIDSSENAIILVPAGTYIVNDTLTVLKPGKLILRGAGAFNADRKGARIEYTGTGTLFECGVADGNPDSTGFTGDVLLENLALVTSTGAVGAKFTNCRYITIDHCALLGWTDKVVWLNGGNIIIKIINSELFGSGNAATSAPYAIYNGTYQFGNFDTRIEQCHISNCGTVAKLGSGRGYHFLNCTVDGAGLTGFNCDGYRPTIFDCQSNYFENVAGQFFTNGTTQPGFLEFTFCNNEVWPGAPVTVFGDLVGVGRCIITNNFVPDAAVKASQTWLGLGNVYTSTAALSSKASISRAPYINKEYEDSLAYALQRTDDLLGINGNFQIVSGGAPSGWANISTYSTWTNGSANVLGNSVCQLTRGGTEFDLASYTVNFTPRDVSADSLFAVGFTAQGWAGFKVNSTSVIDTVAANWTTQYATFSIPAGATSFVAKIVTNNVNVLIGEMRIWQIGAIDFTELGTLDSALYRAVARNMKRGTY